MTRSLATKFKVRAWALLVALLVLAAGWSACAPDPSEGRAATPDTAHAERRNLDVSADASGQIEPLLVIEVKSRVGGELQKINVETGQEMKEGDLIALMDPRDVRNALDQAKADLELASARVATTSAQRRRAEALAKDGVISAQDLETAQLQETSRPRPTSSWPRRRWVTWTSARPSPAR